MEVQRSIFNVGGRPAVVVNYRHPIARVQKLAVFHHVRPVGIYHYQQSSRLRVNEGVRAADEHILVLR